MKVIIKLLNARNCSKHFKNINTFNTHHQLFKIDIINPHFKYVETKGQRSTLLKGLQSQEVLQTSWGSDSTGVKVETQCPLVSPIFTRIMTSGNPSPLASPSI